MSVANPITAEEVYQFVRSYISDKGYSPSVGEIARTLGSISTATVIARLRDLEEQGRIEREPYTSRSIRLVRKGRRAAGVAL